MTSILKHNLYVQTLLIRSTIHSNRNSHIPTEEILLGKWRSGDLKGRYTGLLGAVKTDLWEPELPHIAARRIASALVPKLNLIIKPEKLEPRAIFKFTNIPTWPQYRGQGKDIEVTTEVEYIYRMENTAVNETIPKIINIGSDNDNEIDNESLIEPQWFPLEDIPYDQMPADDREWYPIVLNPKGSCLTGSFESQGKTLLSHKTTKDRDRDSARTF